MREGEVVGGSSRGCGVFWTNPGLSQAQDAECSLGSNSGNKICFVDSRLTIPETHRERERYRRRGADRTQVSKIALPSAFDVRPLLRDNRNVLERHDRGGEKEDRKGKEEINK